jgi:Na+/proline symporter
LILNGIFLAHHVNNDLVLTLPDVFAKRYGLTVEIMVSICTIISFMMLLAGNLVGMANVLSYLWGVNFEGAVWMTAAIVWTYTATGGLFSVAYTDVAQGLMGWSGAFITAIWLITNSDPAAPPPSVGFEGYVYPDEEICQLYNGTNCTNVIDGCCYNPDAGFTTDNGAYPIGDQRSKY